MTPTDTTDTILVHKKDEEGTIEVNRDTGIVTTPVDQRPDWADGLACALLAERNGYYQSRLGPSYTDDMRNPKAIIYQDLGWIGVDAEGDECELAANPEHRMEVTASFLGIDRDDVEDGTTFGDTIAEVEVARDNYRTGSENRLMTEELGTTFGGNPVAEEKTAEGEK